ncbi:hypothetical protein ABZZ74_20110 [Streptomyces sp. NPDC006476]|uniref:hypothetical protein n=1 Tax=Streptomyces sp. NPDC006476 TaxID=3157175 RepID=UPI00339DB82E
MDAADALDALIAHAPTRVIAAHVEDFRDGRRLAGSTPTRPSPPRRSPVHARVPCSWNCATRPC